MPQRPALQVASKTEPLLSAQTVIAERDSAEAELCAGLGSDSDETLIHPAIQMENRRTAHWAETSIPLMQTAELDSRQNRRGAP
jgi:hypothetical protein